MSQLRRVGVFVCQRHPLLSTYLVASPNLYHQLRDFQSTSQVAENVVDNQVEWDSARPLKEMPSSSKLSMTVSFMPGGKYSKLSFSQLLERLHEEHGDVFFFPGLLGKEPVVITFNPDDFEKVHRTEGRWPTRKSFTIVKHYRSVIQKDFFQGAEGLMHTQGEQWGSFRSAVNPILLQPRNVRPYLVRMSNVNAEFLERIREIRDPTSFEVPDNFEQELNRYTMESISVVALDKQIGLMRGTRENSEAQQQFDDLTAFFKLTYELEVKPSLWKIVSTPKYRQVIRVLQRMDKFVIKHVQEAVDRLEKTASDTPENEKGVLEKLLRIDKKIATVMAMDMFIAGVDTSSTTIAGILLLLAKNPEKQQKLREELQHILPQKDSPLTEDSLQKMPYLRACIKESLRIYPLFLGLHRSTGKDLVLSGYRVPKGTNVSVVNFMTRHDSKYYVEPFKFLPERWLRGSDVSDHDQGTCSSNPFVFLPFGFGARMCVGRRIAELEIEVGIAKIIRNFNVEFNHPTENAFKDYFIFVPAIPLKFKFTDVSN